MKYLRLLSWLLCCTVLMFLLASCEEKEPDLTKTGGKKRVFYTENNCHLFVFVKGLGIKLSNWTYERYYKIDGNKLTLWYSLYGMNSNSSDCLIYQKEK